MDLLVEVEETGIDVLLLFHQCVADYFMLLVPTSDAAELVLPKLVGDRRHTGT